VDASRSQSPAELLRRLGLRARKGLSQSFLTDQGICRVMADAAEIDPDDEVLEVGPGLGILTRVLLERAGRVVAVELDPGLARYLPELAPGGRLEVVHGDALRFDPAACLRVGYKLVANLPYQVSSPLLSRYLIEVPRPKLLVIMVQREVAERIAAPHGQASYLSILVQSVADVRVVRQVPPGAFYPRPKVASSVLLIRPRREPIVPDPDLAEFLELVRAGFTQPRKTLANSLAQGLGRPRAAVEAQLATAGLDPALRPQQLAAADWLAVLRARATAR
jgi:16S rRNA (adenine1518-N6/adenine1519-N6)-dimethyltransferase